LRFLSSFSLEIDLGQFRHKAKEAAEQSANKKHSRTNKNFKFFMHKQEPNCTNVLEGILMFEQKSWQEERKEFDILEEIHKKTICFCLVQPKCILDKKRLNNYVTKRT
jgi:hypothetical protein